MKRNDIHLGGPNTGKSPQVSVASATTRGTRDTNEDRVCLFPVATGGKRGVLLAVADGMGGLSHGDRAAELAVSVIRRWGTDILPTLKPEAAALQQGLSAAFQEANRRVWEYGQSLADRPSIGSTLVAALILDNSYVVANAGDSRCYYLSSRGVSRITADHTHLEDLVRSGSLTPQQAQRSPYRHHLTNSLGEPSAVRVDVYPDAGDWGALEQGSILLLSSDGLHGEVHEQEIAATLSVAPDLQSGCEDLLSVAVLRGSADNVTVVALETGAFKRKRGKQRPPNVDAILGRAGQQGTRGAADQVRRSPFTLIFAGIALLVLLVGGWMVKEALSGPDPVKSTPTAAPRDRMDSTPQRQEEAGPAIGPRPMSEEPSPDPARQDKRRSSPRKAKSGKQPDSISGSGTSRNKSSSNLPHEK